MNVAYPNLIPSYVTIGQRGQELIIEYPIDLPKGVLLTVTFIFPNSDEEAMGRAPTTSLGPRTVKAQLPAFQMYGIYTVIPKFPVNQEPKFPPFQLRVLSPVETLINVLAPEEDPYHATASQATVAVVAPLLAYLIQNEQQGVNEDSNIVDQVLAQIFPSMDRPIISLSEYLCGQYVSKGETLLHFCARHQFMKTCQVLTEHLDHNALQQSLGMKGFDGRTPLDISEESENTNLSILLKTALTNKDNKDYTGKESKSQRLWKRHGAPKFDVIKNVMKKIEKKRAGSDETSDKASDQMSDLSQSLLKHLKDTALYCAEVVQSYSTVDKEFGSITLEVGDIAYITREEDKHWCTGIVNDRYCRFPIEFLRPLKQQEEAPYMRAKIPEPKDLLASGNSKVRDLEDMENLVTQHKKFLDYANEKESHSAVKRLSYATPVTRSCSVETGLDEISNCSPLLRRNPLPIPVKTTAGSPKRPGITHREIPLPSTPTTEHEDDSSGDEDEYEPVDFGPVPSSPTLSSPVTRHRSITPRMNQQSPLLKRKMLPSTNDDRTGVPVVPETKRPSVQSSTGVPVVPKTKRPSVQSSSSNRSSIISNRSEDEFIGYAKRDSYPTLSQSDDRVKQSSGTSIASSTHSEGNMHQIESPRKQSQIPTTPQQSTTTSSSEANDDSEDTDGEYDDVARLRLAHTAPVIDLSSSDTKHSYVNVMIGNKPSPPVVQQKPKKNGNIDKSNNETQSQIKNSPTVRPKPVPPPKSMKPTINATPPHTPPLPSKKLDIVASKNPPANATPPLPSKKKDTVVAPPVSTNIKPLSVKSHNTSPSKPLNPVQELAKRFEQN